MSIRPLAIFDLPYLYGFREEAIGLDTARTLTRGNPLGAVGLMAYVNPARHIYSAIANGGKESVLGGIIHSRDESLQNCCTWHRFPSSDIPIFRR